MRHDWQFWGVAATSWLQTAAIWWMIWRQRKQRKAWAEIIAHKESHLARLEKALDQELARNERLERLLEGVSLSRLLALPADRFR